MNIEFRPATPEDCEQVVPLIYSSGPQTFDYVFAVDHPDQSLDFLRQAFIRDQGQFSYTEHTLILADGQIVGCGSLFNTDKSLAFMLESIKQIFSVYGIFKGAGVLIRGLKVERIIPPPKSGEAYICNLAAQPQGKGFGSRLMDYLIDAGKSQGLNTASLDVADSNPDAKALYLHMGFSEIQHRPADSTYKWGKLVGHTYMTKPI
jgi:ribosomal protein S18 acetylase RimI-like enzyme